MIELPQTRALLAVNRRDYDAVYDALDALTNEELHALRSDLGDLDVEIVRTLEGRATA